MGEGRGQEQQHRCASSPTLHWTAAPPPPPCTGLLHLLPHPALEFRRFESSVEDFHSTIDQMELNLKVLVVRD